MVKWTEWKSVLRRQPETAELTLSCRYWYSWKIAGGLSVTLEVQMDDSHTRVHQIRKKVAC